MAVKIRLKRMGKIRAPHYRIVVADARTRRDGRVIEEIGKYHPKEDPSFMEVNSDRVQYWLGVGAQPSEPVTAILKVTGDWQRFKGEAAPAPMLVAEPKRSKTDLFNEALKDSTHEPTAEAVTTKKQAAKKAAPATPAENQPPAADSEPVDTQAVEASAEEPAVSAASAEEPAVSAASAEEPAASAAEPDDTTEVSSSPPAEPTSPDDAPPPASDAPAGGNTTDASDTPADSPASNEPAAPNEKTAD